MNLLAETFGVSLELSRAIRTGGVSGVLSAGFGAGANVLASELIVLNKVKTPTPMPKLLVGRAITLDTCEGFTELPDTISATSRSAPKPSGRC